MDTYKDYTTTLENAKQHIADKGVAVIPNILSPEEITQYRNNMWSMLSQLTENSEYHIKREDESTWKHFRKLLPLHSMLIKHWQVGQSQFMWDIRQNEKVINVFSTLWNTPKEELLVSFDGASIHMPPEITKYGFHRGNKWLHVDQSFKPRSQGLKCYQGMVNLYDSNIGDATLAILEGSNKYHTQFEKHFSYAAEKYKGNWCKLTPEELNFYEDKGCEFHCVKAPAGSMMLWDSRTVHQGIEPIRGRPIPRLRTVAYVCMTPRSWSTPKNIEKKQKAFNEKRMTSHWPNNIKLNGKVPQLYGNPMPTHINTLPDPQLSPLGLKLAGF